MTDLSLTFGCGPYDRTEALRNGIIHPEGIDLTYVAVEPPPVLVDRMVKDGEFDVSEMFLALYMSLRARGQFPFVAIPAFPSRVFRHAFMFVNTNSGIRVPQDLAGKRVEFPNSGRQLPFGSKASSSTSTASTCSPSIGSRVATTDHDHGTCWTCNPTQTRI